MKAAALILALFAAAPARAELLARDTAEVGKKGDWSVGVFNPLKVAVADGFELEAHPLLFLVAPDLIARLSHGALGDFRLTGEYGLSLPTPLMKLTQGYAFPTWNMSDNKVGYYLVPRVGVVASRGDASSRVLTLAVDLAVGVRLSRTDATTMGGIAPLDILMAPALSGDPHKIVTGYRLHVGGAYDAALSENWRIRGYADGYLHGAQPSPLSFSAGVGLDYAVGKQSRLTFGAVWYNTDTQAIDMTTHEHVRSNDFLPTVDFIWAG